MNSAAAPRSPQPPRPYTEVQVQETALFLDYRLGTGPSGQYYIFNIIAKDGAPGVCRLDAKYRPVVDDIFLALDNAKRPLAPVVKDMVGKGWRIDLKRHAKAREATVNSEKEPVDGKKIRAQFFIEANKLEAIERLALAEGYPSYTDWLRALVNRVLASVQTAEVA